MSLRDQFLTPHSLRIALADGRTVEVAGRVEFTPARYVTAAGQPLLTQRARWFVALPDAGAAAAVADLAGEHKELEVDGQFIAKATIGVQAHGLRTLWVEYEPVRWRPAR